MMKGIVDVHCHILPGVDDGPETMEETGRLLMQEYQQGVRKIIFTPHDRTGYFETPRAEVEEIFWQVRRRVEHMDVKLQLYLGCEFHRRNEMIRWVRGDARCRMAGSNYVMVEFSGSDDFSEIRNHVTELLRYGFHPIIAHAERYPALRKQERIRYLADSGAYIQVNAGSLLGMEGWSIRRFARSLLWEEQIHLIGSDAHDSRRRIPCLGPCAEFLTKKIGTAKAHRLLVENPEKILKNEYI